MFKSGPNYNKLKTNLRLAINRLKLLEKKKTELALQNRKEIADYVTAGKPDRAKIRVEHIIREDYLVEAMEILEMYCDLLLARFGLIQQMKTLDDGLSEAISSIIWITPRLQSDVQELKVVSDQLAVKYGRPYQLACLSNEVGTVSEKLMHKMSVQAPPKVTVEKYMIEIAKYYNVEYEPDTQVLNGDEVYAADQLIDLGPAPPLPDKNDFGGGAGGGGGGGGQAVVAGGAGAVPFSYPPQQPMHPPTQPYQYPPPGGAPFHYPPANQPPTDGAVPGPVPYIPPPGAASNPPGGAMPFAGSKEHEAKFGGMLDEDGPPPYFPPDVDSPLSPPSGAAGQPSGSVASGPSDPKPAAGDDIGLPDLPDLPGVPEDLPSRGDTPTAGDNSSTAKDDDIDIDDITRRFEALKKKK